MVICDVTPTECRCSQTRNCVPQVTKAKTVKMDARNAVSRFASATSPATANPSDPIPPRSHAPEARL